MCPVSRFAISDDRQEDDDMIGVKGMSSTRMVKTMVMMLLLIIIDMPDYAGDSTDFLEFGSRNTARALSKTTDSSGH